MAGRCGAAGGVAVSAPVDVLAVMNDMASTVQLVSAEHKAWHARIVNARAAVAELIDALQRIERITSPGESDPAQAFNMLAKIDCIASAALARVSA